MKYRESSLDHRLRKWFRNDLNHQLLKKISLEKGTLRGLYPFSVDINYPITAIAGRNGAGKSTLLAIACCAFHNRNDGYKPLKRKLNYYTFSDFFIQHSEEVPPDGIQISYGIAHNSWRKTKSFPEGKGIGFQRRSKPKGGKWSNYRDRVKRNVIFLGIERIVPHSERSQSKSYSKSFAEIATRGYEDNVKQAVGFVLGKQYDSLRFLEHSKYILPIIESGSVTYSGLNMGAGENALFEIFRVLYSCGEGALLVIDEIELGLHAEAQRKLLKKLKEVCLERKIQIICTTHSKEIFDSIPPEARIYLEGFSNNTKVTYELSSAFAMNKMGGREKNEIDVLVEDDVAQTLITNMIPVDIRTRADIKIIGSASALSRQLATAYIRDKNRPVLAIFDGDQKHKQKENIKHAQNMAECKNEDFDAWLKARIEYLPGETWPESWLIQKNKDKISIISSILGAEAYWLEQQLEYGLQSGKHEELHQIAKATGVSREILMNNLSLALKEEHGFEFNGIAEKIKSLIE